MKITDMPAEFCRQRCNAWMKHQEQCRSRRWITHCDHPEREDAWKYQQQPKRRPRDDK